LEVPSVDQKFYSERVNVIQYEDSRIQEFVSQIIAVLSTKTVTLFLTFAEANFTALEKLRSALSSYEDLLSINIPEYMHNYASKMVFSPNYIFDSYGSSGL
jgi:hypothetical protein